MADHALVYVADPMCSWCWGFAPVIGAVAAHFGAQAPVTVLAGGLAPGATRVMDATNKEIVRGHWDHVRTATGQPFDYRFFEREDFVYDTEPACRALVLVRRVAPHRALTFLSCLHTAFYRDNRDVTDQEVLSDLASDFGLDRGTFGLEFAAADLHRETQDDFALTRRLGVTGFPTLIGFNGDSATLITAGYRRWEDVERLIEAWVEGGGPTDG